MWHKTNPPVPMCGIGYSFASELFLVARKSGRTHYFNKAMGMRHSVLDYPICGGDERTEHPTQKPLALMRELVERFTQVGDVVLDPFMGSGTTGEACVERGRRFIGIELNPAYFALAEPRITRAAAQGALF